MAFNGLAAEAEPVARQIEAEYPRQAAFFRELMEAEPGNVVVADRGVALGTTRFACWASRRVRSNA
jgi:hypothetical protein